MQFIFSTNDCHNIMGLRVVRGRLQYTQDGVCWLPFRIDTRDIIKDAEYGPVGPIYPYGVEETNGEDDGCPPHAHTHGPSYDDEDGIKDAES